MGLFNEHTLVIIVLAKLEACQVQADQLDHRVKEFIGFNLTADGNYDL